MHSKKSLRRSPRRLRLPALPVKVENMIQRTVCIIKPGAFIWRQEIYQRLERWHYQRPITLLMRLRRQQVEDFYEEHKGRHYFEGHVEHMISSDSVVMLLRKNNAITDLRKHIGATDPREAAKHTLRATFGKDLPNNGFHASDSLERAEWESDFFFKANML